MNGFGIAIATETRKAAASLVFRMISLLLVIGTAALTISMVLALRSGNDQIIARLAPFGRHEGWPLLTNVVTQIAAAGGLIAFAVALSWIVGREFADGTIAALFAQPISRRVIASAKLLVFVIWGSATGAILVLVVAVVGIGLGYGLPDGADLVSLGRIFILTTLSTLIAIPVGWVFTLGRGLLSGIASGVGIHGTRLAPAAARSIGRRCSVAEAPSHTGLQRDHRERCGSTSLNAWTWTSRPRSSSIGPVRRSPSTRATLIMPRSGIRTSPR
jgi:ABC-2 type transport system permease protein